MADAEPEPDPSARDAALRELYRTRVMEHARAPHNHGPLADATHRATGHNRLCGDHITVTLRADDQRIAIAMFEGAGCALSMASASLLTDAVSGLAPDAARALQAAVLAMVSGASGPDVEALGEVAVLSAVSGFPARARCVTLAWEALRDALDGSG